MNEPNPALPQVVQAKQVGNAPESDPAAGIAPFVETAEKHDVQKKDAERDLAIYLGDPENEERSTVVVTQTETPNLIRPVVEEAASSIKA